MIYRARRAITKGSVVVFACFFLLVAVPDPSSAWGDADSAEDVLETRRKTLEELDLLEHLYEQAGESAFLDEFTRADDFLNVIRQMKNRCREKTSDSKCAYNSVHLTFLTAKKHETAIHPDVAVEEH